MDNDSLSYKTLKNMSYSLVGYLWPIVFSIFVTRIVVNHLGLADYGVYLLVFAVFGFLGLLDLGLANALIKYISEYHAAGETANLKKLLNSAHSLYFLIGMLGLVVFWLLGIFFLPLFHITGLAEKHTMVVFWLAGLAFFINTVGYVYAAIPVALQRYDLSTKNSLLQTTLFSMGTLALVLLGFRLKVILAFYILTIIILVLINRSYSKSLLPGLVLNFAWDKQEIKKSYSFGIFAAITNLASTSLFQLDRFIIPIFLGPSLLTYYALPGNVAQKISGVSGSITQVLFPLTSALSTGSLAKVGEVYRKTMRNLAVLAASGTAACMFFAYPIMYFWMGRSFADNGWKILIIVSLTHFFLAIYGPLNFSLLGLGKSKLLMYLSVGMALLNIILLVALVPHYGILGAAWAYLFGVLPVPFLCVWVESRHLQMLGSIKFYLQLYAKIIFTAAVFYLPVRFLLLPLVRSLTSLIIAGMGSVAIYLALYALFGFVEPEDWQLFKSYLVKIKSKFLPGGNLA